MNEIMAIWADWLGPRPACPRSNGRSCWPWPRRRATCCNATPACPRSSAIPSIGALAGLGGFSGAAWPLQGIALFLLELGVSVVLFEAGGRIALRWFRHNPMVLLQSLLESTLTALAVYYALRWMGVQATVAEARRPDRDGRLAGGAQPRHDGYARLRAR